MAVNINVPSQVKTYANLAAFPATGALKTIYIAEDTNKTYRWTGSVYTEISASAAMTWGAIGGTLSNQTDLQSALDAKVPTSRTLTINGVTQDLSANRTFTISTGITIGSTAIASGVVGRVLFEGAGNVVQESGNLFWDNTNGRLGIGTSSPQGATHIAVATGTPALVLSDVGAPNTLPTFQFRRGPLSAYSLQIDFPSNIKARFQIGDAVTGYEITGGNVGLTGGRSVEFGGITGQAVTAILGSVHTDNNNGQLLFSTRGSGTLAERARITNTGNVLINTTTDAGFRLDVNGTARVQGNAQFGTGFYWDNTNNRLGIGTSTPAHTFQVYRNTSAGYLASFNSGATLNTNASLTIRIENANLPSIQGLSAGAGGFNTFAINPLGGNVLIGTTTDAGFRLDVNGTARVNGVFSVGADTARIDLWRSSGAFGGRIGTGYSNPAVNHVYITCDVNSRAIVIDESNRAVFASDLGTSTIASAQVAVTSTTRGFLPPRMTTTQRNAIASPAAGLIVYDNTDNKHYGYNGTTWNAFY